jgi:hypothetical protein
MCQSLRVVPPGLPRVVALVVALLSAGLLVSSAGAVSGEFRVLYVLATWGPPTFGADEVELVAAQTDEFFQASSSERFSMPGTVVGPVTLRRAAFERCDATSLRNDAPAALTAGYDRVAFVTPVVPSCRFAGKAEPTEVLLNGQLSVPLAVHELGHTLGLGHAHSWHCIALGCTIDEYGNPFSVMGDGGGDFTAYEKAGLEWLTGLVRPRGNATHEIGPIEGPTTLPQALVVTTATSEFWFESRGRTTSSFLGDSQQPAGVAVLAGPGHGVAAERSDYPRRNILLPSPTGGRARFAYVAGESYVERDVFRVLVERHAPESASLRFEWLDTVAPAPSRVVARPIGGRRVEVSWNRARERGSGVESYTVLVDGRPVQVVGGDDPVLRPSTMLRLTRGAHRVGVFATDRAGNRGVTTRVAVRVR